MSAATNTVKHTPPFGDQRFDTFDQWVSRASSWLTCHEQYNNAEHPTRFGDKGWRGNHFTALCFDSFGRRCKNGADMQRARDEDAFPVWWIWPDQIVPALSNAEREGMEDERTRCAEMVERFAPGGDLYEHGHDDTSMRVAIRAAILSQAGEA